ncbi:Amylosucrase [Brevundimonas sp. SH203]|uniref:alpha-amylase family glycosyl hydrolase n=1 Tax=Brevundimonas sp. SH203 TaxID=345167 RepID=UPI0009C85DC0|nr:alpha-amylase family glycosyl hydrolase [Brevundimonas sp. SH203]GAW41116.1 Amylosucrase [Brevundimonas sp. SH203]
MNGAPVRTTPDAAFDTVSARAVLTHRLESLYGDAAPALLARVDQAVACAVQSRPEALKTLDVQRKADPNWIGRSGQGVYTFYVDRFADDLNGLIDRLDYLQALGVRWLHPLPLLKAREGESDGGFAVQDYRAVEPALGDMATLERLAAELRTRGMGLLLDIVCNHTAREHEWAVKARAGDPHFRAFYRQARDEAEVARWEAHLVDVFPDTAPGSFTFDADMGAWVWTTFYPFQWDLDYSNPDVFLEMLDVLLHLANKGVQGFRLDSAPFLWKREGTNCRNQPETYAIVEAFRAALDIAAPSVVLLAEAIESLDDVLPFFGVSSAACGLAYNNGVMTALWGALADGDVGIVNRLLAAAAQRPDNAAWLNYVRCHDDLIWNALAQYAPPEDLRRWSDFYDGGGFSDGRRFQTAPGGVPSTNGMAAALVGIGKSGVDQNLARARLRLLYGVIHALDGWPLIYMGDEIALGNDTTYLDDPARAAEGRWLHRPDMDWARAEAAEVGGEGGDALSALRLFADRARALGPAGIAGRATPVDVGAEVLAFARSEGRPFLCLANFTPEPQIVIRPSHLDVAGRDRLTGRDIPAGPVRLAPYELIWWSADK